MKSVSLRNWEVFMLLKCYMQGSIALMLDRRRLEVGETYRVRENMYLDEERGVLAPVVSGDDVRGGRLARYLFRGGAMVMTYPCNRVPVASSRMSLKVLCRGTREDLDDEYPDLTRPQEFPHRRAGYPDESVWWINTFLGQMFERAGASTVETSWMDIFGVRSDAPLLVVEVTDVKEESLNIPTWPGGLEYYNLAISPVEEPVPEPIFVWDTPNAHRGPALEAILATRD